MTRSKDLIEFYNSEGNRVCYLYEGEYFYLYDGTPVAWLYEGQLVYSYAGELLGWAHDGWILDKDGHRVFFRKDARGGPIKEARHHIHYRPITFGARRAQPSRPARAAKPARPAFSMSWSPKSNEEFFKG